MLTITCFKCGTTNFSSRNKLFNHLKFCSLNRNPENEPIIDEEAFLQTHRDQSYYLVATGGRIRGKTLINAEIYNFLDKKWISLPNMQFHRGSHGCAAIGENLYALGGGGLHSNLDSMECYSLKTNTWTLLPSLPVARHALSVTAIQHKIYAIGGWLYGTVCCPSVDIYDTFTNTWSQGIEILTPRRLMGICVLQNRYIFTVGGTGQHPGDHNKDLDTSNSNSDRKGKSTIYNESNNEDLKIDEKEGNVQTKAIVSSIEWNSNVVEMYDTWTNTWESKASLPAPYAGQASAAAIGNYIYIAVHGNCLLRYDPLTNVYIQLTESLPCSQWFCFDMVAIHQSLYLLGGNIEGQMSSRVWRYSIFDNHWEEYPSMKYERRRLAACLLTCSSTIPLPTMLVKGSTEALNINNSESIEQQVIAEEISLLLEDNTNNDESNIKRRKIDNANTNS
jgi:hypothetical protein